MRKSPGSPKISMILPIDRKTTLPFLEKCLSFIKASSLALEPWTGTCFVLAALMPPRCDFAACLIDRVLVGPGVNDLLVMVRF